MQSLPYTILTLIFHLPTVFGDCRQKPQSEANWSSVLRATIAMCEYSIWEMCQCVTEAWEITSRLNIWTCLWVQIVLREICFDRQWQQWPDEANETIRYGTREISGGGVVTEQQNIIIFFSFSSLVFSLQIGTQTTWIASFLQTSIFEGKTSCLTCVLSSFPVSLFTCVLPMT